MRGADWRAGCNSIWTPLLSGKKPARAAIASRLSATPKRRSPASLRRNPFEVSRRWYPGNAGSQTGGGRFTRAGFARRVAEAVLACAGPAAVAALLHPDG
jgi:hypothetical protein